MEISLFTYPIVRVHIPSPLSKSAQSQVCPALDMYQNIFPYAYDVAIEQSCIGSAFRYLSTPVQSCLESDSRISRITKTVLGAFLYKSAGRYEGISRGTKRALSILSSWQLITSALAYTIPYIFAKELAPWVCKDYYHPQKKVPLDTSYKKRAEIESGSAKPAMNPVDFEGQVNGTLDILRKIEDRLARLENKIDELENKYPRVQEYIRWYEGLLEESQKARSSLDFIPIEEWETPDYDLSEKSGELSTFSEVEPFERRFASRLISDVKRLRAWLRYNFG